MRIISLLILLFLTGCGFTPVYSPSIQSGPVQESLSTVAIDVIPDRSGQMVRNHLIDRLHTNSKPINPVYRLSVSPITENLVEIGIDKDDEASRAQLRETAKIRLIKLNDGEVVLNRTVRSVTSYNILAGQFTTFVTRQDAREQALRSLANNIVTELELHFKR